MLTGKAVLLVESKCSRSGLCVRCACARWLLWDSAQGVAWRVVRLLRERRRTGLCTSSCCLVGLYCSTTVLLIMYSLRVLHYDLQVQNLGQFWNFGFAARPRQVIFLHQLLLTVCVCVCVSGRLINTGRRLWRRVVEKVCSCVRMIPAWHFKHGWAWNMSAP